MSTTTEVPEIHREACAWCRGDVDWRYAFMAHRTFTLVFEESTGAKAEESASTVSLYFCNPQHRLNYFREQ